MALLVNVGTFQQMAGTGLQSITGVGFTPKGILFWGNAAGEINDRSGGSHWRFGMTDGTTGVAAATNSGLWHFAFAPDPPYESETAGAFDKCLIGVSTGAGGFSTPLILGYAALDSLDPDGFTLDIQSNVNELMTAHHWNYLAIGGDGISVTVGRFDMGVDDTVTIDTLGFDPTALIGVWTSSIAGPGHGPAGYPNIGFATACGPVQYAIAAATEAQSQPSESASYQKAGLFASSIDDAGTVGATLVIDAFVTGGFTATYTGFTGRTQHYMAIGGCAATLGTFTQPTTTGAQSITTDARSPRAVLVAGINKAASSVAVPDFFTTMGACDGTNQVCAWTGDLDNLPKYYAAAEAVNSTHLIECDDPVVNTETSTVNSLGMWTGFSSGNVGLDWTQVDGVAREWIALVLADDFGTGPCGTTGLTVTYPIRRERIFLLPSDLDRRMFLQRLEFLVQAGVGLTTGQGSDPTFTVEISRDGGQTYGTVYVLSPGALGDYAHRSFVHRLGSYRNATVRIAMSDPVLWALLESWADVEKGTS